MTRAFLTTGRAIRSLCASRAVRFVLVGGLNTLFGYGLFLVCLAVGIAPGISLVIANSLGTLFNFVSTGRLAFGSNDVRRLPAFLLTYAILCGVNVAALRALIAVGLPAAVAQAVLILPFAATAYIVQRDLVFCRPVTGDQRS